MSATEHAFLATLPASVRNFIAGLFVSQGVGPGTVIFREGQIEPRIYLVEAGQVDLEMEIPGRGRQRILSLGPGDLLGWSGLFGNGPMTASARATMPTRLWAADGAALILACEAHPEAGYHFMRHVALALSRRLIATRLQLLDLFQQDASAAGA